MFRIAGRALKIEKIPLSKALFFADRILEPKIEIFESDLVSLGGLVNQKCGVLVSKMTKFHLQNYTYDHFTRIWRRWGNFYAHFKE